MHLEDFRPVDNVTHIEEDVEEMGPQRISINEQGMYQHQELNKCAEVLTTLQFQLIQDINLVTTVPLDFSLRGDVSLQHTMR